MAEAAKRKISFSTTSSTTHKTDVVIAGAGISGVVAALELLESDLKVILVDRDEKNKIGGLAKESFGAMFFVNSPQQRWSGIKDSPELALKDWLENAEFGENDIWPRQWAEFYVNNCTQLGYKWLRKQGVRFLPVVNWVERISDKNPGNSVPRFHIVWGSGKGLSDTLVNRLLTHRNAANLKILFDRKVTDIIQHDGKIAGLKGVHEPTGNHFTIKADNTVIASGGICGSIEKVKANWYKPWGDPPELILNGSHKYAEGILHDAASEVGANVTHMDKLWLYTGGVNHPNPRHPQHGLSILPCKSALWLDSHGRRFGPEPLVAGFDARNQVETVCKQEHKYSWQVMNMKIAIRELSISGSEHNPAIRDRKLFRFLKGILFGAKGLVDDMLANCDNFVTANSVAELTDKMQALSGDIKIDRQAVATAVENFDKAADPNGGVYDRQRDLIRQVRKYLLDGIRTCKDQKIDDTSAYPLIAVKEHILSRKTMGGIQTNLESRVLTETGDIIPNLYAIGEAAGYGGGGVHGLRSLEGTFLGGCVMSSRLAAADILNIKLH